MQVDGMMLTNNAQNRPMVSMLNLSSIQEMQIIKGGFNAEYGNARSGFLVLYLRQVQLIDTQLQLT